MITSAPVRPTGVERRLGADELIVSKTDPKGLLTYVNKPFLRLSAYREEEVLGRPHNMIRHPDMPRCVFQLLWDTIASGEEMFAYVVNLAGDGAHYWVFAHVTPTFGPDGTIIAYHSSRRAPHPRAVEQTVDLYRSLCATEQGAARGGGGARAQVSASRDQLQGVLAERGQTFSQYVWSITPDH